MKRILALVLAAAMLAVTGVAAMAAPPDTDDEIFLTDAIFDDARNFNEGLAAVKQGGKWGFINQQGIVVIPVKYDSVTDFGTYKSGQDFYCDVSGQIIPVTRVVEDGVEWYLNQFGDKITPHTTRVMGGGDTFTTYEENGKKGICYTWMAGGEVYLPAKYDDICQHNINSTAGKFLWYQDLSPDNDASGPVFFLVKNNGRWQVIESKGRGDQDPYVFVKDCGTDVVGFHEYIACKKDGKWGFIDYLGTFQSKFDYLDVCRGYTGDPDSNQFPVKTANGKWAYIELQGKTTPEDPEDPEDPEEPDKPVKPDKPNKPAVPSRPVTEREYVQPTDNAANSDRTIEAIKDANHDVASGGQAHGRARYFVTADGTSVPLVSVELSGAGVAISVDTMKLLSESRVGLRAVLNKGAAEVVIPGGFEADKDRSIVRYPIGYQAEPYHASLMASYVKESGAKSETCKVGGNFSIPTTATITLRTKLTGQINVYHYNEETRRFTLVASPTVQGNKVTFAASHLGNFILTTGTI